MNQRTSTQILGLAFPRSAELAGWGGNQTTPKPGWTRNPHFSGYSPDEAKGRIYRSMGSVFHKPFRTAERLHLPLRPGRLLIPCNSSAPSFLSVAAEGRGQPVYWPLTAFTGPVFTAVCSHRPHSPTGFPLSAPMSEQGILCSAGKCAVLTGIQLAMTRFSESQWWTQSGAAVHRH